MEELWSLGFTPFGGLASPVKIATVRGFEDTESEGG
jgi:hypothetical protein